MTDRGKRSSGAGIAILLVAAAIQGLTPDRDDLASSRILRLLETTRVSPRATGGNPAPTPISIPHDQDHGIPGEISGKVVPRVALRARLDDDIRSSDPLLPPGYLEPPIPSSLHPLPPPRAASRGPVDLIGSLCRLLC